MGFEHVPLPKMSIYYIPIFKCGMEKVTECSEGVLAGREENLMFPHSYEQAVQGECDDMGVEQDHKLPLLCVNIGSKEEGITA